MSDIDAIVEWRPLDLDSRLYSEEGLKQFIGDYQRGWLVDAPAYKEILGTLCIGFDQKRASEAKKRIDLLKTEKATGVLYRKAENRPYLLGDENMVFFKTSFSSNPKWQDYADRVEKTIPLAKGECLWFDSSEKFIVLCRTEESLDYEMMNLADIFGIDVDMEISGWNSTWGYGYILKIPK